MRLRGVFRPCRSCCSLAACRPEHEVDGSHVGRVLSYLALLVAFNVTCKPWPGTMGTSPPEPEEQEVEEQEEEVQRPVNSDMIWCPTSLLACLCCPWKAPKPSTSGTALVPPPVSGEARTRKRFRASIRPNQRHPSLGNDRCVPVFRARRRSRAQTRRHHSNLHRRHCRN